MGFQIGLILYYFFLVNDLVFASTIFGIPIQEMLKSSLFSLNPPVGIHAYLQSAFAISTVC
jgi:flagellar biosynthesis protein FliP